jgi:hypothetical protein
MREPCVGSDLEADHPVDDLALGRDTGPMKW